jgi:hypothetical protein
LKKDWTRISERKWKQNGLRVSGVPLPKQPSVASERSGKRRRALLEKHQKMKMTVIVVLMALQRRQRQQARRLRQRCLQFEKVQRNQAPKSAGARVLLMSPVTHPVDVNNTGCTIK